MYKTRKKFEKERRERGEDGRKKQRDVCAPLGSLCQILWSYADITKARGTCSQLKLCCACYCIEGAGAASYIKCSGSALKSHSLFLLNSSSDNLIFLIVEISNFVQNHYSDALKNRLIWSLEHSECRSQTLFMVLYVIPAYNEEFPRLRHRDCFCKNWLLSDKQVLLSIAAMLGSLSLNI